MKLAYRYMLNQFLSTQVSLFGVLFLIVSMVFFIQLARMTASLDVSIADFMRLYSYMMPRILVFTIPVSFFIALTIAIYRLSRENESIVYFTLGFSPALLAKFFLKIALLFTFIMLAISLVLIPVASKLQNNFIDYKKTQVKLNIKIGEFGQKFLDWMVFVESESGGKYENIIMYHPMSAAKAEEQLIIASQGLFERDEQSLSFKLIDGNVYHNDLSGTWHIGHFEKLDINTLLSGFESDSESVWEYWSKINEREKRAKEFVIYTLISLFPLASTLFALSFGLVTYRYERGFVYVGIAGVIGVYFAALSLFYQPPLIATAAIFALSFIASLIYFKMKILTRY